MDNIPVNQLEESNNHHELGNRLSANKMDSFPHHCIGLVHIRDKYGQYRYATGFLINSWAVLTAASALFRINKPFVDPQTIEFCLDLHGDLISSTRIKVKDVKCSTSFQAFLKHMSIIDPDSQKYGQLNRQKHIWDIAILQLEDAAIRPTHPHYLTLSPGFNQKSKVTTIGYEPSQQKKSEYYQRVYTNTVTMSQESSRGIYETAMKTELKGSPVLFLQNDEEIDDPDKVYVVGVQTSQDQDESATCTLISEELVKQIQEIIMKMDQELPLRIVKISDSRNDNGQVEERKSSVIANLLKKEQQKVKDLHYKAGKMNQKCEELENKLKNKNQQINRLYINQQDLKKQLSRLEQKLNSQDLYVELMQTQARTNQLKKQWQSTEEKLTLQLQQSHKTNIMLLKKIKNMIEKDKEGVYNFFFMNRHQKVEAEPITTEEDLRQARTLVIQGQGYFNEQKWKQAMQCYRQALQLDQNSGTYFDLAKALEQIGELRQSVECYKKAIELTKKGISCTNGEQQRESNNNICYVFVAILLLVMSWNYFMY